MLWSEGPCLDIRDNKAICYGVIDKNL
jgi:hypothetical protein